MINENINNNNLLELIFEIKKEFASYKKETTKKIAELENIIEIQDRQLKEKDNEIYCLKQTIENMKEEHAKVTAIMQKEINDLKEENKNLKQIIKIKDKEISKLNKKIEKLENENKKLKNQLSKDSHNSSKPSSTDGFHKVSHNTRGKSTRKVGGQDNHNGNTLTKEKVEKIIDSNKKNVILKKEILYVNNKRLDGTTKYKVDTQMSVIITEYNLIYKKEATSLPKELKNTVIYGNNLKALVVLLNTENAISVNRTVNLIKELTDNVIELATGTVMNIIYELKEKVQPSIKSIKDYLLRYEVNHKDETMLYCNSESRWYHVFSNPQATYYYYDKSRGNKADIEKGLLQIFTGTLVHDHLAGLYKFQCEHAECNVHILRYLRFATDSYQRKWSKELEDLLLQIKNEIKNEMNQGNNCLKTENILKYEQEYSRILSDGEMEFKDDKNPYKDYNGEDMKLLRRLKKYKENHLAFMYDFRIPFDNNLAERDLRMIKAKKKISGCFRSDKGGEAYTDIKSYTSTMKKRKNNLFESIRSAFNNNPILINA